MLTVMARGWESKSVEAQQDEAARARKVKPVLTSAQRETLERRRTLELTRSRLAGDLSRATAPHHRAMLEHALGDIDAELEKLS